MKEDVKAEFDKLHETIASLKDEIAELKKQKQEEEDDF